MRRSYPYIIVALYLLMSSCHKNSSSPGTFKIQFQPKWGQSDLILDSLYSTPDGKYLKFSSLGLYLSHIRLVRNDNSEVEADSAVLLVYANKAITFNLSAINGDYKAIKFGIGLDSLQNRIVPGAGSTDDPFNSNALWWGPPQYHLFTQTEGYAGTTSSLGSIFFYHVGTDSMYRSAIVNKSFSIKDGQTTALIFHADLEKVFYGPGSVDVIANPATHTTDLPNGPNVARAISNAFPQIFSIQQ